MLDPFFSNFFRCSQKDTIWTIKKFESIKQWFKEDTVRHDFEWKQRYFLIEKGAKGQINGFRQRVGEAGNIIQGGPKKVYDVI